VPSSASNVIEESGDGNEVDIVIIVVVGDTAVMDVVTVVGVVILAGGFVVVILPQPAANTMSKNKVMTRTLISFFISYPSFKFVLSTFKRRIALLPFGPFSFCLRVN
jgi:tRNA(Met) C34 N-acetyltransferase TmcA